MLKDTVQTTYISYNRLISFSTIERRQ